MTHTSSAHAHAWMCVPVRWVQNKKQRMNKEKDLIEFTSALYSTLKYFFGQAFCQPFMHCWNAFTFDLLDDILSPRQPSQLFKKCSNYSLLRNFSSSFLSFCFPQIHQLFSSRDLKKYSRYSDLNKNIDRKGYQFILKV